jgi:hypothetical protein
MDRGLTYTGLISSSIITGLNTFLRPVTWTAITISLKNLCFPAPVPLQQRHAPAHHGKQHNLSVSVIIMDRVPMYMEIPICLHLHFLSRGRHVLTMASGWDVLLFERVFSSSLSCRPMLQEHISLLQPDAMVLSEFDVLWQVYKINVVIPALFHFCPENYPFFSYTNLCYKQGKRLFLWQAKAYA